MGKKFKTIEIIENWPKIYTSVLFLFTFLHFGRNLFFSVLLANWQKRLGGCNIIFFECLDLCPGDIQAAFLKLFCDLDCLIQVEKSSLYNI